MWLVRLSGFVRSLSIILNHYVFYMTLHRIYSRHWQWLHLSLGETPFFSISSRIHDTIKSLKLFNLLWQEEMQCCFAMKLQKYIYWVFILGKVFLNCHCPYLFARNDTNQHNTRGSRPLVLCHLIEPEKSSVFVSYIIFAHLTQNVRIKMPHNMTRDWEK